MAEDSLLREIDSALQHDRWHQLWKHYGSRILFACAAVVLVMGGTIVWQQRASHLAQQRTHALMGARDAFIENDFTKAQEGFAAVAKDAPGTIHAALADVWLAKTKLALQDHDGALDALAAATQNSKGGVVSSMACLQGAMLAPDDARFTSCLPAKDGDAFAASAAEFRAVQAAAGKNFSKAQTLLPATAMPLSQQRRVDDLKDYLQSAAHAQ